MRYAAGLAIVIAATIGCGESKSSSDKAPMAGAAGAKPAAPAAADKPEGDGFSGHHRADPKSDWVPAEFKKGMNRFKDPGVYADGVPVGMLRFGELPVPLEPAWHEERAAVPFGPDSKGPRFKIVKQRRYNFIDYFRAIGLDVDRIKEVHLYGGSKRAAAMVVTGDELRSGKMFTFRFGAEVRGKPIPACANGLGDGKCPDSVGAIAVYIDRKPPVRDGAYFVLDGKVLKDIPYFGEPLRGGIRVYLDGRLATTIKRRKFKDDDSIKQTDDKGVAHFNLYGFLAKQKVATDKVVEAWVIHHGKRVKRLTGEELAEMTFTAQSQKRGEIQLGSSQTPTNALALHSKPVKPEDFPVILPHERDVLN